MKFAFGIFRLLPAGGLERNAVKLAELLLARGHRIVVHTTAGGETAPAGAEVVSFGRRGRSNHGAMRSFSGDYAAAAHGSDLVVGFQKLAGLDLLYCADWCFVDRPRPPWQRLLPRFRAFAALERACFARDSGTRVIALAAPQLDAYRRAYATPVERTALIPPTLEPKIRAETAPTAERRAALRSKLGLDAKAMVWLWVGLQPLVKGLDRVFAALAKRPDCILVVCGADRTNRQVSALLGQAEREGFAGRIRLLGLVDDSRKLAEVYGAADILVHPARLDVTGTVILEAIVNGLPVIATGICGYSPHVDAADAGVVLDGAFDQLAFERALAGADAERRVRWSANGFAYGSAPRLFAGLSRAADLMEAAARHDDGAWLAMSENGGTSPPRGRR